VDVVDDLDTGTTRTMTAPIWSQRPLGIRLICVQKGVWGLVLLGITATLLVFYRLHVTEPFQELFEGELLQDPHDRFANLMIRLVPTLTLRTEVLLAAGAALYAVLEAIEVWGLLRDVLWVEVLVVVETAALLPYEIWELIHHASLFKTLSLVINVLIVWYLAGRYLRKREAHLVRELRHDLRG